MGSSDREGFSRSQNDSHLLLSPWGWTDPGAGEAARSHGQGAGSPRSVRVGRPCPAPQHCRLLRAPPAPQLRPTAKKQASLSPPISPLTRLPLVSCSPGTRVSVIH